MINLPVEGDVEVTLCGWQDVKIQWLTRQLKVTKRDGSLTEACHPQFPPGCAPHVPQAHEITLSLAVWFAPSCSFSHWFYFLILLVKGLTSQFCGLRLNRLFGVPSLSCLTFQSSIFVFVFVNMFAGIAFITVSLLPNSLHRPVLSSTDCLFFEPVCVNGSFGGGFVLWDKQPSALVAMCEIFEFLFLVFIAL